MPIPPPPSDFLIKSKECRYANRDKLKPKVPVDCQWAIEYPEIQRACILSHVCTTVKPKQYRIKLDIQAIVQEGPTCGLVALTMLTGGRPAITDVLTLAREKHFTNHGEMFSANNMQKLVSIVFDSLQYKAVDVKSYSGELNCHAIKQALIDGACVMVAYPFLKTHSRRKKKSHNKKFQTTDLFCLSEKKNENQIQQTSVN